MFKNKLENKENLAVMYLRLSKEDGERAESNSISNQREIINMYASKNNINVAKEYVDDGYSGTSFDRPAFKEMMKDAYDKKFSIIIVKDLSRFGRDYIEAGKYIQRIFPELGIRFISVNDNYDSSSADINDTHLILPIKNFINDIYARDISNKVRSSQKVKREKGEFISAFAPYGYKKSKENKNKLIIDENVAEVIRNIFDMKLKGYSSKAIADELNRLGILTPKLYKENQGFKCNGFQTIKSGNWSAKTVNRIIENEVYIGNTLQGKSSVLSYKNKKQLGKKKEEWIRVENTHEALISKETFVIANEMLKRDLNNLKGRENIDLFSGMLFCKDCGSQLVKRLVRQKEKEYIYYICSKYNKGNSCTRHSIKRETLINVVSETIKSYIEFNEKLYSKIKYVDLSKDLTDIYIPVLKREKVMVEKLLSSLYTDLKENITGKTTFARVLAGLEKIKLGKIISKTGKCLNDKDLMKMSYFIFQDSDYHLFSESVLDEMLLGLPSADKKENIEKAKSILEGLSLEKYMDKHPFALSRGEKQRLTIACGMMKKAEIFIYDEPTSGCDKESMLLVARLIEKQLKNGVTVLVISHDFEFLANTVSTVWVMENGKIESILKMNESNKILILEKMRGGREFDI